MSVDPQSELVALVRGLAAELEAVKTAMDRLYQEQRLLRNRAERIDGRMERAEIRMLSIDPHYPDTQQRLPADVLADAQDQLERGLSAPLDAGETP